MTDELYKKIDYQGVKKEEVHSWRPPCSCGVELSYVMQDTPKESVPVHSWRPPCSCGVSLEDVVKK